MWCKIKIMMVNWLIFYSSEILETNIKEVIIYIYVLKTIYLTAVLVCVMQRESRAILTKNERSGDDHNWANGKSFGDRRKGNERIIWRWNTEDEDELLPAISSTRKSHWFHKSFRCINSNYPLTCQSSGRVADKKRWHVDSC